jgi:hypothetical protein
MELCPDLRPALTGSATDPCWEFSEIGQCRDLSMPKFQTQEFVKMTCHRGTLMECIEERTFLLPACYEESMGL